MSPCPVLCVLKTEEAQAEQRQVSAKSSLVSSHIKHRVSPDQKLVCLRSVRALGLAFAPTVC